MDFIEELTWRGLIDNITDPDQIRKLKGCSFYCGFDPTASSLQIGNLVPIMAMSHIARSGLKPIVVLGGATGAIGDPSGKNTERNLLEQEQIKLNLSRQGEQFKKIFSKLNLQVTVCNNQDWLGQINFIEFLRDVGKYFTISYMLQKETVKTRVNNDGISFTEFSYMLLQAYDYLHLYQTQNCRLHIGGSDQWGNITAGLELIRKKGLDGAHAITFPLITNAQGKKLGKSESGTLWLDPTQTSPFKFHQYWLNIEDQDVICLLKIMTLLDKKQIDELTAAQNTAPEKRVAQRALADFMCDFIHGPDATTMATKSAAVLFGGTMEGLSVAELSDIFSDVPSTKIDRSKLANLTYIDLLVETTLSKSKGEAKRLIQNGGAYLNNDRISDIDMTIQQNNLIGNSILILRAGKKNYHLIQFV